MTYIPTRGLRGAYASLRGGTKTNPQKPSIILIFIISLYASPAAHTPATIPATSKILFFQSELQNMFFCNS